MDDLNNEENDGQSAGSENFEETDPTFVDGQKRPNNASVFGIVGLLLLGGAAFYFFYLKAGPQSASASTLEQADATATINEFLHGSGGSAKLMEQTLRDTQKVVQEFQSHAHKKQIPVEELATNPFRLKIARPETSDISQAVPSHIREDEERQRIVNEAGALELESVMRGGRSACLLNNTLYHVGEQIGNFTIEEIRPKSVIVRQEKYRFELTMKK